MFAFNMDFLSPRAYKYIREKFDNNLPHPNTIGKWFSVTNANCGGGFQKSALNSLNEISKEMQDNNKKLLVAVSFDEMAIRQHISWLHHKKKFSGYIDFGTTVHATDPLPIATQAIVIMVNGLNAELSVPVAYFYINALIAQEKAIMIATVLKALTKIGIRVLSITSDGLFTNPAAYEILGASIDGKKPYFLNPDTDEKVFVLYDAPHMIKRIRNCLSDARTLHDSNGQPIEWNFIEQLYESSKNIQASHKLTKKHIDWKQNEMKVVLATQTISNSVAINIEKLRLNGDPHFQGSYQDKYYKFYQFAPQAP